MKDNTPEYTPVEKIGGVYVKRDDLYCRAGIQGGKVRACWHLATHGLKPCEGLITASARKSPQAQIVARLANVLGIPARCHMPTGGLTEEMKDVEAHGGTLIQHRAGYNNVLIARAMADHKTRKRWRYIPFGMEHPAAVKCTRAQVANVPRGVKRIVIPLGSGISAAGVLHGLRDCKIDVPVLGVRVGADPIKRLNAFGPFAWHEQMTIVKTRIAYHKSITAHIGDVPLDPIYEAKCLEYVRQGDLLWVVGIRAPVIIIPGMQG